MDNEETNSQSEYPGAEFPEGLEPPDELEQARMPIVEHLRELRIRLIRSIIAVIIGFAIAYAFSDQIFAWLTRPLLELSRSNFKVELIGTGVGEAFFTKIKVALIAGLFMACPGVFHEVWKFISPGLYKSERRTATPFIIFASLFFILGGYFCWAVVFTVGYRFFISEYASIGVTPTIRISEYLAFSAKLMLAFAVTFEMPIFAYFLTRVGMIDHRMMTRQFKYAILIIAVIAGVLAPPGPVPMFLLAIPLLMLYVLSIGVSYVFRIRAEGEAEPVSEDPEIP